jgi:hypothetical protein
MSTGDWEKQAGSPSGSPFGDNRRHFVEKEGRRSTVDAMSRKLRGALRKQPREKKSIVQAASSNHVHIRVFFLTQRRHAHSGSLYVRQLIWRRLRTVCYPLEWHVPTRLVKVTIWLWQSKLDANAGNDNWCCATKLHRSATGTRSLSLTLTFRPWDKLGIREKKHEKLW